MLGHVFLGQSIDSAAAQQVNMGNDAVQGKGGGGIKHPLLDRIQSGLRAAHSRTGCEAVPDGLYQLGADTGQAPHLFVQILASGGGIAQNAAAGPAGDVHARTETGFGPVHLMLQHLAIFQHAAQTAVRAQNAVHRVLDGYGLAGRRRRRVGGFRRRDCRGKQQCQNREGEG